MAIMSALRQHIRMICAREIQNSIAESVKQVLEDKIDYHGLRDKFKITDTEIVYKPTESLFVFKGLQKHTVGGVKSMEGFNRLFVEEAQSVSKKSLETAIPTLRADDTELWFAWNPYKPDDPVEKLFAGYEDDPNFALVTVNYWDNPWLSQANKEEAERDKIRDPDKYAHVWCGEYIQNSEARVFRNWRVEAFETPQNARFYFGADWGFANDPTVLVRCFIVGRTIYVDQEVCQVGCAIDATPRLFDRIPGSRDWQITADSARPETIDYMRRHGFPRIVHAVKGTDSVKDGVEFLKSYDIIVHPRCENTIRELRMYSYETDKQTGEVLPVLADRDNHVIDALRYALESVRRAMRVKVEGLRI